MTQQVKLCRECRHHMPEPRSEWNLRCMHPVVNARDRWALAGAQPMGSNARDEREKTFLTLAACGMRGALWEPIKTFKPELPPNVLMSPR